MNTSVIRYRIPDLGISSRLLIFGACGFVGIPFRISFTIVTIVFDRQRTRPTCGLTAFNRGCGYLRIPKAC